jgi:hypothetical protein
MREKRGEAGCKLTVGLDRAESQAAKILAASCIIRLALMGGGSMPKSMQSEHYRQVFFLAKLGKSYVFSLSRTVGGRV